LLENFDDVDQNVHQNKNMPLTRCAACFKGIQQFVYTTPPCLSHDYSLVELQLRLPNLPSQSLQQLHFAPTSNGKAFAAWPSPLSMPPIPPPSQPSLKILTQHSVVGIRSTAANG
jgi:hypothetical protein